MDTDTLEYWRAVYTNASRSVLANTTIRHYLPSLIFSPDDAVTNDFLINLATAAIGNAWAHLIEGTNDLLADSVYYNVFPGEHYRLLRAITNILNPQIAVEIGTYTGMGTVAILQGLSKGSIHTFDVVPWNSFSSHLKPQYFSDGQVVQHLADVSSRAGFEQHRQILDEAELIFLDAPKDGQFEYRFLPLICGLEKMKRKLLILDDIKFVNMIDLWRSIKSPKLDISSFGHWSGTGLVDLSEGLLIA